MPALRSLPVTDPGAPPLGSSGRFLLWLAGRQKGTLTQGVLWGVLWMGAQAAVPAALGRGIDQVSARETRQAVLWALVVLGLGVVQAVAGILRHRMAVANWINAAARVQQLVARRAAELGGDLTRQVATGEVVAVSSNDVERIGSAFDVSARFAGALVSFVGVTVVLFAASPTLGAVVIVGVPLIGLAVGPLLKPLERRESAQRARFGEATELAADTVAGLRVLRGIGGEEMFLQRFRETSDGVRRAAVQTARIRSLLDAMQVALPGAFVVAVTWFGAHLALRGEITVGELVAFYGYTAFLVIPLRTVTETAHKWTRAVVGARRVIALLRLERALPVRPGPVQPLPDGPLVDVASGFVVERGLLTALVSDDPEAASLVADRLGGHLPGEVTVGGLPLAGMSSATVRAHLLVQDKDPMIFARRVGDGLDVPRSGRVGIAEAVTAADADEIVEGLPEGLATELPERARSLSGGQRQRVALARSLVADPDVLVLDEPTSAVDAHTEARVGAQLARLRRGRTTVLLTTSPLLLEQVDRVSLLEDGRVVASGTHRELLRGRSQYRAVVVRDEDDEDDGDHGVQP